MRFCSIVRHSCFAGLVCGLAMMIACNGQTVTPVKMDESSAGGSSSKSSEPAASSSSASSSANASASAGSTSDSFSRLSSRSSAETDIEFTIEDYQREFFQNNPGATATPARYDGKFLRLTGEVEVSSGSSLYLKGMRGPMVCDEPRPGARAMPGQTVVLRGKCTLQSLGVSAWKVIKVTGDPPPTTTVEQLLKDLAADKAATNAKYDVKWMVLTGQITDVKTETALITDKVVICLSPPGTKPEIRCLFNTTHKEEKTRNSTLQTGKKVKVVGRYRAEETFLDFCELVEVEP
jgi:hypothetical protein